MIKKINYLLLLIGVIWLFTGCGAPVAPTAKKEITQRPSLIYKPNRYTKLPMKYPLKVGVLQFTDSRIMPFYGKENFFQQDDIEGLTQMAYLELKNSNLFGSVRLINEKVPFEMDQKFFYNIMDKYQVDAIFVADVTSFVLLRNWRSDIPMLGGPPAGVSAFSSSIDIALIGQLIYLDGGIEIWNGKVNRKNKLLVKEGEITTAQLANLATETQQQLFEDLVGHISKNGKRMMAQ